MRTNTLTTTAAVLAAVAFAAGCAPSDSERCGGGFYYEEGACWPEDQGDTASDSDPGDAGDDGGDGPTGLGEPCTDEGDECDGYEADYCVMQPGSDTGYCSLQGCSTDPDDCPEGYACCDFADSMSTEIPNFCGLEEDVEAMGGMCE